MYLLNNDWTRRQNPKTCISCYFADLERSILFIKIKKRIFYTKLYTVQLFIPFELVRVFTTPCKNSRFYKEL